MSVNLDDKLANALAVAIAHRPRANLQQIAKSAGISKATLYRISPTREGLIDMLMERATVHMEDALMKAELERPPFIEALTRLTQNVVQSREFHLFWHSAQWMQMVDANNDDGTSICPSFYGDALEEFFLRGQKAGVFRIDMPAKWIAKAYDHLLFAAADSAHKGEIAIVGMASLVDRIFLSGAVDPSVQESNTVVSQTPGDA